MLNEPREQQVSHGTANFHQLPINAPKCPVMNFQRDGQMQMNVYKGRANYEPNSLALNGEDGGVRECPITGFATAQGRAEHDEQGNKLRMRAELFADHYSQARLFWKSMTESEQAHIASSFTFELSKVELKQVAPRVVANLRNVDEDLARRVAAGIGIDLPKKAEAKRKVLDLEPSPALSIQKNMKTTLEGRKVAILYADGSDPTEIKAVQKAVERGGSTVFLIAPKVGGAKLKGGSMLKANGQLAGSPSQLFDAVAIIISEEGCKALVGEAAAVQFAMDAFGHLKAIGASAAAGPLLKKAGVVADPGVTDLGKAFVAAARSRFWDREPSVRNLA